MTNFRRLVLTLCATWLAGCGSSPPVRYYGLEAFETRSVTQNTEVVIGLGPVRFPKYLDRPQIVTHGSGAQIRFAEFDRWAEPIGEAFQRTLAMNLDGLLEDVSVVVFPFGAGLVQVDYRILGSVSRFDLDDKGNAVLHLQWGIVDSQGNTLTGARRSDFRLPATDATDYASVVAALSETVSALSHEVADVFETVRQHP